MAEMIRKLIPVDVKEVADRVLEIAGSTEDKDRAGDIIRASGWKLKNFKKNPVFMWAHRYDDPPIGRAVKTWIDKDTNRLMFNIEFAPAETYEFADTIYKLYKGGFLHATSVGFIPLDWDGKGEEHPYPKWEGNIFTSQDLLELSAVPVPANPNALVSARDQGLITVKEFEDLNAYIGDEDSKHIITEDVLGKLFLIDPTIIIEEEEEEDEEELPQPRAISQEQLGDELDFVLQAIKEVGLNDEQMPAALDLASAIIMRTSGADIPVDILSKVGTVLNDINKERLSHIRQLAQDVSESAETTEESDEQVVPPEPEPDSIERRAQDVAAVADLVIAKLKGKRIPK